MILGTSRAAQGVVPSVIDSCLGVAVYNFAFDCMIAPYGELYYDAVKTKLGENCDKGTFLLSVDPMGLSYVEELDGKGLRERKQLFAYVKHFYRPNYAYLLKNCRPLEWARGDGTQLHDDGWLEVTGADMDSLHVKENIAIKMKTYESYHLTPSEYRLDWLKRTIALLQGRGEVYLFRIPVSQEMKAFEDRQWPDFDDVLRQVVEESGVQYFSFISDSGKYRTTDGNHLYRDDAKLFTADLCDSLYAFKR